MSFAHHLRKLPLRYGAMAAVAGAITIGLFFMMFSLIDMGAVEDLEDGGIVDVISFVRLDKQNETSIEERELPPRILENMPTPPIIDTPISGTPKGTVNFGKLDMPPPPPPEGVGDLIRVGAVSAGVVPLVRVRPVYPQDAANQRLEGWVELRFTIGPTGSVNAPKVVRAFPSDVFNAAALQAIRKWKYRPRVENGQKVAVSGIQVRLKFELDEHGQ